MNDITTRILVGFMFTFFVSAAYLFFNAYPLSDSYESRMKIHAIACVLIVAGLWCLVFAAE